MFDLLTRGGPVTWLLLVASIVAMSTFLERFFHLHRAQLPADDFLKGLFNVLRAGNTLEAVHICDEAPGPVARLARAAILRREAGAAAVERAMEEAGAAEIPRLERRIALLATIGQIATLLGLLGTALGLMDALEELQGKAPFAQTGDLAGGLWQALICTAAGLAVAIFCQAGYNLLISRVAGILLEMERGAAEMSAFFAANRGPEAPSS